MTALTAGVSTPTVRFHSHNATTMIHRDQHQIRAQFLHSLGIVKATPLVATLPVEPKSANSIDNNNNHRRISFAAHVDTQEIPSHRDYSAEDRQDLWNSSQVVSEIVRRNTIEFLAEGWDWQQVLEEDSFVRLPNGELIHPAILRKQLEDWQQREQARRRKKKQRQYKYKSITACLDFGTPKRTSRSPSSRNRQRNRRSLPAQ